MAYAIMSLLMAARLTSPRGNDTVFWRVFSIILLTFLGACHPRPLVAPDPSLGTDTEKKAPQATAEKSRPFPADTLYELLVAELAGGRGEPVMAQQKYHEQAAITQDADLARRATQIAEFINSSERALDSARLWSNLEPDNTEPQTLVAIHLVKQGKLEEAFDQSLALMEKGLRPAFQTIAFEAAQQDRSLQTRLLDLFRQALTQYPDHSELLTGESLLLHYLGDDERALQSVNQAITANKRNTAAYALKAGLLEKLGDKKAAARTLRKPVKAEPGNQRLRLQYARLLSGVDLKEAQKQFRILVDNAPMDADLKLSLALVSMELEDFPTAREYFEQLLFLRKHISTAYFYLAQISEQQQKVPRAIELYHRVNEGDELLYAATALCRLYLEQSQLIECQRHLQTERKKLSAVDSENLKKSIALLYLIEADILRQHKPSEELAILNEGLQSFPDHADLRYARSMLYEQANNLNASEIDLRVILEKYPDNANALNALGYTLVNKTTRLQEGYELITRALALAPDNPAILDSMGWALYRLNRHDEALSYLQKAMASFPNHEVAAHLGEVLWIKGKQKEARNVWKQGLKDDPDSPVIKETRERLGAGS